jgi:hypothetical protein
MPNLQDLRQAVQALLLERSGRFQQPEDLIH